MDWIKLPVYMNVLFIILRQPATLVAVLCILCISFADVVKLADTQDLGSCTFGVQVQVLSSALINMGVC